MATASNFSSLLSSSYTLTSEETTRNTNLRVHRYALSPTASIEEAANAITTLLENYPHLCFVSGPIHPETLERKIQACPYLIINGDAVCLSDRTKAPSDLNIKCRDVFFSEAIIQEPIQCERGHTFEREHIEGWVSLQGDVCPHGRQHHSVGPLEVDPYIEEELRSILEAYENLDKMKKEADESKENAFRQDARIASLQALKRADRTWEIAGLPVKFLIKQGKSLAKTAGLGKKTGLFIGKKIPIISLFVGAVLAGYRIYQGLSNKDNLQYVKAAGELASGVAACFPGAGTISSVVIDGVIFAHDLSEINGKKIYVNIDVNIAHEMLTLDLTQEPTKEVIDQKFRELSLATHPDKMAGYGEFAQTEMHKLQQMLQESKDLLYTHYGYSNLQTINS